MNHNRSHNGFLVTSCALSLIPLFHALGTFGQEEKVQAPEFFAFCFDTHDAIDRDYAEQAGLLKELGFSGAGHVELVDINQRVKTLDEVQLRLFLAGLPLDLSKEIGPQRQVLETALPVLKNRDVILYVVLRGLPTGDSQGMQPAVSALRELSDQVAPYGVRLGIYPHTNDWVATVPQAVQVAQRVGRPNCGIIFNLCHFLRNEPPESLDRVLELARPHLFAITINGADLDGTGDPDWHRLIQPLDRGSFDIKKLLNKLKDLNYTGPIGLMCYGIGGDARDHLTRSMAAWRKLQHDCGGS